MRSEFIKVPKDRLAVLIGPTGSTKKLIEESTGVKLRVDSQSGEVEIVANEKDALSTYAANNIVKAIARGFSPKNALTLLEDDVFLDVIDVTDFVGEKEKEIAHKRGRVIGSHGSIRKDIEEHCDTMVSVYGKTIALIGRAEGMYKARRAVEMLLEGASHHIVLSFLKKVSRDSVEPMEV